MEKDYQVNTEMYEADCNITPDYFIGVEKDNCVPRIQALQIEPQNQESSRPSLPERFTLDETVERCRIEYSMELN